MSYATTTRAHSTTARYSLQPIILCLLKVQTQKLVVDDSPRQVIDGGLFGLFDFPLQVACFIRAIAVPCFFQLQACTLYQQVSIHFLLEVFKILILDPYL